jgi:hypothetical protein
MGWFIENHGFNTMFTYSAIAVTAVAVITSLFYWDAKDNYSAPTPLSPSPAK